jgi:coenzyme PQQ precursor peptide PqqA
MPMCCLFAPFLKYRGTASLLRCKRGSGDHDVKISLAKFSPRATLWGDQSTEPAEQQRSAKMAWKAPKIIEVPVGMEINMYACAARK